MQRFTDNEAVSPTDYDQFCVTAPTDKRLPNGGGYQVCGLYDLAPGKVGQVDSVVKQASAFGKQKQVSDFFTISMEARLPTGARFGGGIDSS